MSSPGFSSFIREFPIGPAGSDIFQLSGQTQASSDRLTQTPGSSDSNRTNGLGFEPGPQIWVWLSNMDSSLGLWVKRLLMNQGSILKVGHPSPSRSKSSHARFAEKPPPDSPNLDDSSLDYPDLGPILLKLVEDMIASGDCPYKALDYAIRAAKSFERCQVKGEPSLDLVMSLYVLAAIHCSLGKFEEAVPVLKRVIQVPDIGRGPDHAPAAFSGHMQLGDTYSMLGQVEKLILCYDEGLKI